MEYPAGKSSCRSSKVQLVSALFVRDQRVLLCYRNPNRRWYPDTWDLVGGHVEERETAQDALVREVREELGIDVARPVGPPVAHFLTDDAEMRIWMIKNWDGYPFNAAPREHRAIGWFDTAELGNLKLAHPNYSGLISRLIRSEQPH
ncbi:NUDIX domain-containing protein [Streptomyces sp. NPDC057950]|uniref:NUDIX domain-containing protein n=1 Tax=Streptomyces sp. NPDC057950 TaxID=3346288 RepID=UPI0036EF598B